MSPFNLPMSRMLTTGNGSRGGLSGSGHRRFPLQAVLCVMFVAISFGLSSCASSKKTSSTLPEVETIGAIQATSVGRPPVELKVVQEFVRDGKLHVNVHLVPRTNVYSEEVVVSLTGLKEGKIVEQQKRNASEVVTSKVLEKDKAVSFRFALDNADSLGEYQVACSWGQEARAQLTDAADKLKRASSTGAGTARLSEAGLSETGAARGDGSPNSAPSQMASASGSSPSRSLTPFDGASDSDTGKVKRGVIDEVELLPVSTEPSLEVVEVEKDAIDCETGPCDVRYALNLRLKNESANVFEGIKLALGLFWANDGDDPELPIAGAPLLSHEEEINLAGFKLNPNQSQLLRVRIREPIPVVPGGRFIPHVRILEYVTKNHLPSS